MTTKKLTAREVNDRTAGRVKICGSQDADRRGPASLVEWVRDAADGSVVAFAGGEHLRAGDADAMLALIRSRKLSK